MVGLFLFGRTRWACGAERLEWIVRLGIWVESASVMVLDVTGVMLGEINVCGGVFE